MDGKPPISPNQKRLVPFSIRPLNKRNTSPVDEEQPSYSERKPFSIKAGSYSPAKQRI